MGGDLSPGGLAQTLKCPSETTGRKVDYPGSVREWGERNEKELCGQVSLATLELTRLKVSLLQTSSDPLQDKSALCFSKKRNWYT